jgi:hypothetical protein
VASQSSRIGEEQVRRDAPAETRFRVRASFGWAIVAKHSSAGQGAGDCLVAEALAGRRRPARIKAIVAGARANVMAAQAGGRRASRTTASVANHRAAVARAVLLPNDGNGSSATSRAEVLVDLPGWTYIPSSR